MFSVSAALSYMPQTLNTVYASQTAAPETDAALEETSAPESETPEAETELQPVLLESDKVSTEDFLLYSSACVVMDVDTGAILYSKNRSDRHYPASTTKILTTLLALENTELTDNITFSREAVESISWDSSNMELKAGDQLTMEQALYGVMLQSANEAAYGVGEYVSGSIEQFAQDMTDYAVGLGCRLSHFTNASGLHDDAHYTTAKDLATIARAAAQNEDFCTITGTVHYSVENIHYKVKEPETEETESEEAGDTAGEGESVQAETEPPEPVPEPFPLYNHHKMVNNEYPYEGCYGGKTGYTGEARNTLVTYARRDDMNLVCVILDCTGGNNYTYRDTETALNYCFENFDRLTEEYNEAQALLDYSEMGLRDWYHPTQTPLSADEGFYPYAKEFRELYAQYLTNRQAKEALDKAISEKDVQAFMEYSRLNNYRPLIIAAIVLILAAVILSLILVQLVKIFKRKRSRRRYMRLKRKRLAEDAALKAAEAESEADGDTEPDPADSTATDTAAAGDTAVSDGSDAADADANNSDAAGNDDATDAVVDDSDAAGNDDATDAVANDTDAAGSEDLTEKSPDEIRS